MDILKVPYFVRFPGLGKVINTFLTIPDGISFSTLNLKLRPTGGVTGNYEILEEIGRANNVDISQMEKMEFIARWYREHLKNGGTPIDNYDELKSYFWDALGYIKYPKGSDFHSLLDRDEGNNLCIDFVEFIDVCKVNERDFTMVSADIFVCTAYDEYIETGGEKDSETDEFITRLKQKVNYESEN